MRAKYISAELAKKYSLVPDAFNGNPNWHKIVVMDYIKKGVLDKFMVGLKASF